MSSNVTAKARTAIVELTVQDFFKAYPLETYEGLVRLSEVVSVVQDTLHRWGMRLTAYAEGEVYDAIRDQGPVGEKDSAWLQMRTERWTC